MHRINTKFQGQPVDAAHPQITDVAGVTHQITNQSMAQAAGRLKLADNHPSPDYIAGFVQYANGVRGVYECGAGAPDQPEVGKWWGKCRMGAQGTDGFAEVLTNGGWRAVTKDGVQRGEAA